MQYHNCKLEDIVVAQIALTLSVQMIKNDYYQCNQCNQCLACR